MTIYLFRKIKSPSPANNAQFISGGIIITLLLLVYLFDIFQYTKAYTRVLNPHRSHKPQKRMLKPQ